MVGVARCFSYDQDGVSEAVGKAIERAGGLPRIQSDEILLKANLLSPSHPDKAVTTHPHVLKSVIRETQNAAAGRKIGIRIADNPGYIFTDAARLFDETGIAPLALIDGVSVGLLSDKGVRSVRNETFRTLSEARISCRYLDAPYCVNVAKLKTHVETEISACIKNIFGTADTQTRKASHRSVSQKDLAEAISDLYTIRPPEFHVLDAVVGMEGDGPSHGKPRNIGWIAAGDNALAVDWVATAMMCYDDPRTIPLMSVAIERGIGPRDRSEIAPVGAEWEELPTRGSRKSSNMLRMLPTFLRGLAHNLVSLSPRLVRGTCTRCGICKNVCPVDAIKNSGGYPEIDRKTCVKCLCCHEMCPTGAMEVKKPDRSTRCQYTKQLTKLCISNRQFSS